MTTVTKEVVIVSIPLRKIQNTATRALPALNKNLNFEAVGEGGE